MICDCERAVQRRGESFLQSFGCVAPLFPKHAVEHTPNQVDRSDSSRALPSMKRLWHPSGRKPPPDPFLFPPLSATHRRVSKPDSPRPGGPNHLFLSSRSRGSSSSSYPFLSPPSSERNTHRSPPAAHRMEWLGAQEEVTADQRPHLSLARLWLRLIDNSGT